MLSWLLAPPAPPPGAWPSEQRRVVRKLGDDGDAPADAPPKPPRGTDLRAIEALRARPMTAHELADVLGCASGAASNRLSRLAQRGLVRALGGGMWAAL